MSGAPGCGKSMIAKRIPSILPSMTEKEALEVTKICSTCSFIQLSNNSKGTSSSELREKVEFARNIQRERYKNIEDINSNAEMTPALIKEFCILEDESKKLLQMAFDRFNYSARTFHKFLKVARTFADMDGADNLSKQHIAAPQEMINV